MNILDKIIDNKKGEVADRKKIYPVKLLEQSIFFSRETLSLKKSLQQKNSLGIIAEFKRQSPSKGIINANVEVEQVTKGYANAGASGLSILTDKDFFGGSNVDLIAGRSVNTIPILRKDFVIDEYQIIEAKSIGADVILLIAAVLDASTIKQLTAFAHSLNLEVLLEVHSLEELQMNLSSHADMIGVNNRNLKTFEVSIETSKTLSEFIPEEFIKISESGISNPNTIFELKQFGFQGFLMGENFMKNALPEIAAKEFIESLKK